MNIAFWMSEPVIEWSSKGLSPTTGGRCRYKPFSCEIIIREKYKQDLGIINHEMTHYRQYKRLFWYHSTMTMLSQKYRLKIELEAYTEQVKAYRYTKKSDYKWIVNSLYAKYDLDMPISYIMKRCDAEFIKYLKDGK